MLDGVKGAAAPVEWLLSRICEEFNCTPAEALREDGRLVMDVLELRDYARAKGAVDRAQREEDVPDSPMVKKVFEIVAEIAERQRPG